MNKKIQTDDIIFNFFKQICDEKDNDKCVKLGKSWIDAMEKNLDNMESNLDDADRLKFNDDIRNNREHLNTLKNNNSSQWREYATQCMIEIIDNKG